jgi:hypothetical protein
MFSARLHSVLPLYSVDSLEILVYQSRVSKVTVLNDTQLLLFNGPYARGPLATVLPEASLVYVPCVDRQPAAMWFQNLPATMHDVPILSAQLGMVYFIAFAFWSVCTLTKNKPCGDPHRVPLILHPHL